MTQVKILIVGFTNADCKKTGEDETTCPTITLVRADGMNIICDPGVAEQKDIISALKKEGLSVPDITHVFITHSHIDHYRNIGMFPSAKTIEYWGIWDGGKCDSYPEQLTDDIKIIKTPGHSYDGLTMLVKTADGIIGICGDIFWKENYPEKDPYAIDDEQLKQSRTKFLSLTNYIVPGHGNMYKVK